MIKTKLNNIKVLKSMLKIQRELKNNRKFEGK